MPSAPINIRFDLEANGLSGFVGVFAAGFTASVTAQGGAQLSASAPLFSMTANIVVGNVGIANLVMRPKLFTLSATGSAEAYARADVVVPAFRSIFGVYRGTMPRFVLRGIGSEYVAQVIYQAYAINVKNAALTEYTNFPFNHLVRFGGETIGFTDTGAYTIGASDDDGTAIDGVFELPPEDFGTSKLKRMPYMYIGAKTGEHIKVSAVADEGKVIVAKTATTGRTRRAKLSRGAKATLWAGRIENTRGEDFAIDSVEYLPMILERKV